MENEMIPMGMNPASPMMPQDRATDLAATGAEIEEPNGLDFEDIKQCVIDDFCNDVKDKENYGWLEKQEYNIKAYYGIKDAAMMRRPWPGASAYPVPITPTLLDTGHANIKASMRADDGRWCTVEGVGAEDIRKARPLESLMNWQLGTQIPMDKIQDMNIFRALISGNGIVKVMQDFTKNAVKVVSFDVENFYIPIDAEGVQFDENHGHCTQIIPLTKNDVEMRKSWGVYQDLDRMVPGARISHSSGQERIAQLKDGIAGVDKQGRTTRETYFLAETYLEYFSKSGSGYGSTGPSRAGVRPKYLIVWWSPNGGTLHRIAMMDEDHVVPFANHDVYPNPGYFFSMSLPEKIRNIQEKANYADKQNTDAMDRMISPALFVSDTAELEKSRAKRVPGGIYNLGRDVTMQNEPQPIRERGFEFEVQRMWMEAQQLTGLIDISYGSNATKDKTLGQTQLRSFRADIRFADVFDRYGRGFKDELKLIHHYNNKFMDRKVKVKVVGYADYKRIEELFPNPEAGAMGLGVEGQYDFSFAGAAVTEREKEKQDKIAFYTAMSAAPDVMGNAHDNWNVKEQLAQSFGIRDLETVITKPAEALIMSAQGAIQRVVSGQVDIPMRPGIDTDSYCFEIEFFMKSETFLSLDPLLQQELMRMLKLSYIMRAAEMKAMIDMQTIQQGMQARQQMGAMGEEVARRSQMPAKQPEGVTA